MAYLRSDRVRAEQSSRAKLAKTRLYKHPSWSRDKAVRYSTKMQTDVSRGKVGAYIRLTVNSRRARAGALALRVGVASNEIRDVAEANPGSYAASYVENQKWNRRAQNYGGRTRRVADHFTTDWSQRGSAVERASALNRPESLRRPAFSVPEYLHLAHPTTWGGHEAHELAYHEREAQLGHAEKEVREGTRPATQQELEEGRYLATKMHMDAYYASRRWKEMANAHKAAARASFERALNQPTILRAAPTQKAVEVKLSPARKKGLLDDLAASFV
jgi:hypothetical protein